MKIIGHSLLALSVLVIPVSTAVSVVGTTNSAQAEELGVGVRVEDRDHDRDHRRWHRRSDENVVIIKKHHNRDRDDD